ncbi:MAG: protein-L-isoaspartate(D-aspartate) O-methyltransferase [Hyphomicrobiaceae bacterium]
MDTMQQRRDAMVERQLIERGIADERVLAAMRTVPRELFVPEELAWAAYNDSSLPIGARQTISQPYVVALMISALELDSGGTVLEVGAGSGYAAAILAQMGMTTFAIERIESLADFARSNLERAGFSGVHVRHDDGTMGWPDEAPFDGILVSAGAPKIPLILKEQLRVGGRMVVPVGSELVEQVLVLVKRVGAEDYEEERFGDVRFVPLIGEDAWQNDDSHWLHRLAKRVSGPFV